MVYFGYAFWAREHHPLLRSPVPDARSDELRPRRWNGVVAVSDTVIYRGDFAMGPKERHKGYCASLHGQKILVIGNHDRPAGYMREVGFCHSPVPRPSDYPGRRRPAPPSEYDLALCGHVHQEWKVRDRCVNVGVDVWRHRPVALDDILQAAAAAKDAL